MFFLLILRERFDFLPPIADAGAGGVVAGAICPAPFVAIVVVATPEPFDTGGVCCGPETGFSVVAVFCISDKFLAYVAFSCFLASSSCDSCLLCLSSSSAFFCSVVLPQDFIDNHIDVMTTI